MSRGTIAKVNSTLKTKPSTKKSRREFLAKAREVKKAKSQAVDMDLEGKHWNVICPIELEKLPEKINTVKISSKDLKEIYQQCKEKISFEEFKIKRAREKAKSRAAFYRKSKKIHKMNIELQLLREEWIWVFNLQQYKRPGITQSWYRSLKDIENHASRVISNPRKAYPQRKGIRPTRATKARRELIQYRRQRRRFLSEVTDRNYKSDRHYRAAFLFSRLQFDHVLMDALDLLKATEAAIKKRERMRYYLTSPESLFTEAPLPSYMPKKYRGWHRLTLVEWGDMLGTIGRNRRVYKDPPYEG